MTGEILSSNSGWIKIGDQNVEYEVEYYHLAFTYESLYTKLNKCRERIDHHERDKILKKICSVDI